MLNLQRRARAELETRLLVQAQSVAAAVGAENMAPDRRRYLQRTLVPDVARQIDGRVIVVDTAGVLVADSEGPGRLGEAYATPGRPEVRSALARRPSAVIRHSEDLGQDIMVAAAPIIDEGRLYGAVRLTQGLAAVTASVRRTTLGLLVVGLAGLAAGLLIAFGLAESLARPMGRLVAAARRLGAGDLTARAGPVGGAREVEELARSFDQMASRLERTVQAQREFVANASHQLRTPLTGMKLRLESAALDAPSGQVRRSLEAAEREADRLSRIVDRLLLLSREIELGQGGPADVGEAVARAAERWREPAERAGATVAVRAEPVAARADPTDLDQVLDNLLDNALAYAPGPITVEAGRRDQRAFLAVQDRGPGIPEGDRGRVTERFFRGRGARPGGSGLGLAIVRELAEKWGGAVEIVTPPEGGTRIEVTLPLFTSP